MPKTVHHTPHAPAAIGPYSQAVEANGLLFCSGQISLTPSGERVGAGDVVAQTRQCMDNLGQVLCAAGLGFQDVVKTTIYLTDLSTFGAVNEVYGSYFGAEPPARETVEVSGLPKSVDVEISCIAAR
jgi:2-iminobutanoate/2-iminopropanoate deaminase